MRKRLLIAILVPVVVALLYGMFFLKFVRVPTGSMKNTILIGDHLVVNKVMGGIQRGAIVVFKYPRDTRTSYVSRVIGLPGETIQINPERHLVLIDGKELAEHRIRAAYQWPDDPGQLEEKMDYGVPAGALYTVYCQRDDDDGMAARFGIGEAFRLPKKGDPLPEEMRTSEYRDAYDADHDGRYDADQYFCMGDNRDSSEDSRYWGTVPANLIVGRAFAVYWSKEPGDSGGHIRWKRVFSKLR